MGQKYYLAIDVGGTKILFAVFERGGEMICATKIKTPPTYEQLISEIGANLKSGLSEFDFSHCCCAVPGSIDFQNGIALAFGSLPWKDVPIKKDLQALMPDVKIMLHNDAKLAGLSESTLLQKKYKKVLYLTISTGIGGGVIIDGVIDSDFDNFEPGQMVFEHEGKTTQWEDIASGKALKERYGKKAAEIDDNRIWQDYVKNLVPGFENLLANIQPDAVVLGGSVGAHFEKFQPILEDELKKLNNPLVPLPPLLKAQRPEEAVIYGCYEFIRQNV